MASEIPPRSASPYLARNVMSSRCMLQKARVPRQVCASAMLADKLTGYMLKPLSHSKGCKQRCEHLRHEIEGQQKIGKCNVLWHGDNLSYVAETKAKTIQLRNRTLRLLEKADSYEQLPVVSQKSCEGNAWMLTEDSVHHEIREEDENQYIREEDENQDIPLEYQSEPRTSEEPLSILRTPKRSPSKKRATVCLTVETKELEISMYTEEQDDAVSTVATERVLPMTPPPLCWNTPSYSSRDSTPEGSPLNFQLPTPSTPSRASAPSTKHRTSQSPSSRPSSALGDRYFARTPSKSGACTPPRKGSEYVKPQSLRKHKESLKARLNRKTLPKEDLRHSPTGLTSFIEKHFLFEEKRLIATEQDNKAEISGFIAGAIRISEYRDSAGSMLLEVCLNQKGWMRGDIVERIIYSKDVQKLFTWGNKQNDAAEARYKWLGDLVHLRLLEEAIQSESPKSHTGYTIVFNGYDNVDETERYHPGIEQFRTEVHNLFGHTRELCNQEVEFTKLSLRTGFSDKRNSVREARKELEIESARQRFDLYENTSRALHDWYTRLDVSGDGQIDEEEFSLFMQGIMNTLCKGPWDAPPVSKHWADLRTFNGTMGFTQFVNYLIGKFPRVQEMTAYEVKRFEEKAKRAPTHHVY